VYTRFGGKNRKINLSGHYDPVHAHALHVLIAGCGAASFFQCVPSGSQEPPHLAHCADRIREVLNAVLQKTLWRSRTSPWRWDAYKRRYIGTIAFVSTSLFQGSRNGVLGGCSNLHRHRAISGSLLALSEFSRDFEN
jgi:hypothetical protein